MRKAAIVLVATLLAGGALVGLDDSPRPRAWTFGPGLALADDTKLEMPNEAFGFTGTLFGQVVKETDPNGCFDIKVIKVVSFAAGNKAKLDPAALTAIWKGKADWCRPEKPVNKCEPLRVGDTVVLVGRVCEVHIRYTKVTREAEPKPGDAPAVNPPTSAAKPPSAPTTAPVAPPATSQPSVTDPAADKLKLAQMYIDNSMKAKAREVLNQIIEQHPRSEAAKTARRKLAELDR